MPLPTLLVKGNLRLHNGEISDEIPIKYIVKWIKSNMIEYGAGMKHISIKNRCLIVKAKTGSGKSTTMIVNIFRIYRDQNTPTGVPYNGKTVLCCQPKVLTAISIAESISKESWAPDMLFGQIIGYQTGGGGKIRPPSGLVYATSGILAAQLNLLEDSAIMSMYSVIIIDEAHERTMESDVLLMMLKNFYIRNEGNKNLPFLILTSATFETKKYIEYFGLPPENELSVEGSAYPIETIYPEKPFDNYYDGAVTIIKSIIEKNTDDNPIKSDILMFVPGGREMTDMIEKLEPLTEKYNLMLLKLNSDGVANKSEDVYLAQIGYDELKDPKPSKRIILSTNVAETGLTLDSIKYVIDSGYYITTEYYPEAVGLTTRFAPQSRIIQRRGRVGRKFPGVFYPLYTKETFDALPMQQLPEILIRDYSNYHLLLIREQLRQKTADKKRVSFSIEDMDLLELPPTQNFIRANVLAHQLGFLRTEENTCKLTKSGAVAAMFSRVKMECIKMTLCSYIYDCAMYDMITLTAIFMYNKTLKDLMITKYTKTNFGSLPSDAIVIKACCPKFGGADKIPETDKYYYKFKMLVCDDYIQMLIIYDKFIEQLNADNAPKFCLEAGLDMNKMLEFTSFRAELISDFINSGNDITRLNYKRLYLTSNFIETLDNIKKCMHEGFKSHLLEHVDKNIYKTLNGVKIEVKPFLESSLIDRMIASDMIKTYRPPKYLITNDFNLEIADKTTMQYKIICSQSSAI